MSTIKKLHYKTVVRPLRTTFATALGAKTSASSIIVHVELDDGRRGTGEVPTSFVLKHETLEAIEKVLAAARPDVIGRDPGDYAAITQTLRVKFPQYHMSISGLEVAMFRAALAAAGQNEFRHWGGKCASLETDITIPFVPDGGMLKDWLGRVSRQKFTKYKVKVSGVVEVDTGFVTDIEHYLSHHVEGYTIRLDGNQGFTVDSSLKLLDLLARRHVKIEIFEQPLPKDDYAGMAALTAKCPVPVIADEMVFSPDDCRRAIEERLAHGVNIKIAKSGISGSAKILELAKAAGLKLMIGCMTETMVGLSASINFAAGTGAFDYLDLDSIQFLYHSNSYGPITISGNHYQIAD
jgi:L-alanine-DL-glutamate epimerase-like enolase superfamily enzyme